MSMQSQWQTVWHFLKKIKIKLPYDPATPLLGIYMKKPETLICKNTCTPMFIAALFTVARMWSSPSAQSAGECLKKLCYIYTMELLGCKKKKEILPFVTAWIDLESIMLSE